MQLSDLKELRKVIKSKEPPVDWVYGLYVSAENEPVWEQLTLLGAMEEAEYYRHINLFSRILAGGLGKNVFAVPLTEQPEGLLNLRSAPSKTSGTIYQQVYSGATVTVVTPGDQWTQVRHGGVTGYMMTQFLK